MPMPVVGIVVAPRCLARKKFVVPLLNNFHVPSISFRNVTGKAKAIVFLQLFYVDENRNMLVLISHLSNWIDSKLVCMDSS